MRMTKGQGEIVLDIQAEMATGVSLQKAVRRVINTKKYNHLTVNRVAQKLAQDMTKLRNWTSRFEK